MDGHVKSGTGIRSGLTNTEGILAKKSVEDTQNVSTEPQAQIGEDRLVNALVAAMSAVKPVEKKTISTRTKNTPWTPPKGVKKPKLKRKMFQHGLPLYEERLTAEQIELLNKLRPGRYAENYISVIRRKDRGIDIDYPVKTQPQKMRLHTLGIHSFNDLVARCNKEADAPKPPVLDTDGDAF